MSQTKKRRFSTTEIVSPISKRGATSSSRVCQARTTLANPSTFSGKRKISLNTKVIANDGLNPSDCVISDSLCDLCLLFVTNSLDENFLTPIHSRFDWIRWDWTYLQVFKHYSTQGRLKNSADAGCELCLMLLGSSQASKYDPIILALPGRPCPDFDKDGSDSDPVKLSNEDLFSFFILPAELLAGPATDGNRVIFEFIVAENGQKCQKMPFQSHYLYGHARQLSRLPSFSPCSENCFKQIKEWHKNCSENHTKCSRRKTQVPSRLLDLSSLSKNRINIDYKNKLDDTEAISLVETEQLAKSSKELTYVALSYCWGGWSGLTTKKDNLATMMHQIRINELPEAVKDAVFVCHRYGIHFLWVDALCICQDDVAEWNSEVAKMAGIYGGCAFTLSALSSQDANDGFLKERKFRPLPVGLTVLPKGTQHKPANLFIRRRPRSIRDEINYSSLSKRAWTFQERLLAPAVLHYGHDQMIWECNTDHLVSETGEKDAESEAGFRLSDIAGPRGALGSRPLWDCIVEGFSRRLLTYATDRLPAISGTAFRLREVGAISGRYKMGLWEKYLVRQLTWRSDDLIRTRSFQPTEPNKDIPTWSWAHRNIPIEMANSWECVSALSRPARFLFLDHKSNNSGAKILNGVPAVCLHGWVQNVSVSALSEDSLLRCARSGSVVCPGLPGSESKWWSDLVQLPPGTYSSIKMLRTPPIPEKESGTMSTTVYIILRKVDHMAIPNQQNLFTRVGVLLLYDESDENFNQSYVDVFCKTGAPLLTNGKWKKIVLI